jgi:hypothetical protein
MKIAIIDCVNQDIGLKILFPEATYYIHNSEDCTINSRIISYKKYDFIPKTDWSDINDVNYDYIFIVLASYNILSTTPYYEKNIKNIFDKITIVINNNNFKFVVLFDNFDFDYDPNDFINNSKINVFFKRNYNTTKTYKDNVIPFPFIMFGDKSLIEKCDTELLSESEYFKEKNNRIFFTGALFTDKDYYYNMNRDRLCIYNKIKSLIYNPDNLNYSDFINTIRDSKYSLDLLGVGDPNKRTFEILLSGSLMISEYNDLLWPFDNNESFSKETIFKNDAEFFYIINELSKDNELYLKCLRNQHDIVKKYFNKEWLRDYITKKIENYFYK